MNKHKSKYPKRTATEILNAIAGDDEACLMAEKNTTPLRYGLTGTNNEHTKNTTSK